MAAKNEDFGILNEPMKLSKDGVYQIMYCLSKGSREVEDLLLHECNIIYECKVCTSLFRSLANFIVHKRGFCKEHCCEKMTLSENPNIPVNNSALDDTSDIGNDVNKHFTVKPSNKKAACDVQMEVTAESDVFIAEPDSPESSKTSQINMDFANKTEDINNNEDNVVLKSPTKISQPYLKLQENVEDNPFKDCLQEISARAKIRLKPLIVKCRRIPTTNNAVMQAIYEGDSYKIINYNAKHQLEVTQRVGHFNGALKSEDETSKRDCETKKNECKICKKCFPSTASLSQHVNNQHKDYKLMYRCPCCPMTLSSVNNVCRHLKTVHGKTKNQVVNLRKVASRNSILKVMSTNKTYKCATCGTSFEQRDRLASHMLKCKSAKGGGSGRSQQSQRKPLVISNSTKHKTNNQVAKKNVIRKRQPSSLHGTKKKVIGKRIVSGVKEPHVVCLVLPKTNEAMETEIMSQYDSKHLCCKICSRDLSTATTARRHIAIHLGFYRYKCSFCLYQFYYKSDANKHFIRSHMNKQVHQHSSSIKKRGCATKVESKKSHGGTKRSK